MTKLSENNLVTSKSGQIDDSLVSNNISSVMPKMWGPERIVKVPRDSLEAGLGISIVGGRVESTNTTETLDEIDPSKDVNTEMEGIISGIFIKSVIPESPAGRTNQLFTGDHLIQVDDIKLNTSDQLIAVQAIKNAGDPVRMKIRSLMQQVPF